MNATYFGIIDWFDTSKGFGLAKVLNGSSIFIHRSNINKYPAAGDLVSINEIHENKNKRRRDGIGVVVWKDVDELCNNLFEKWSSRTNLEYCEEIEILLRICDDNLLSKIIELNKDGWLSDDRFIQNLVNKCNSREIRFNFRQNFYRHINENYLKIVADFCFEAWKRHRKYSGYLSCLFSIYGTRTDLSKGLPWENSGYDLKQKINSEYLIKALEIDHKWIFESNFSKDFTTTYKNVLFIDRKIIYEFVTDIIKKKETRKYDQYIKWLINNGDSSIVDFIIEDRSMFSNKDFINQFKKKRNLYSDSSYSRFLTKYIISQNELGFSDDLKWLLTKGNVQDLKELINHNKEYWQNNTEFVDFILDLKCPYNRNREKHQILSSAKDSYVIVHQVEAYQEFVFDMWKLNGSTIIDKYLKWLLFNGEASFLLSIFESEKTEWLKSDAIADLIFNMNFTLGFQEEFIDDFYDTIEPDRVFMESFALEISVKKEHPHHKVAAKWIFSEGSLKLVKKFIHKTLNYSSEAIEKIYLAFYPSNDSSYYVTKAKNSNWSYDFRDNYIRERTYQINERFKSLFREELEMTESSIPKKNWEKKNTHSATDLANFAFCPASHILNQKYDLNIEEQEKVFIGLSEHNKQRLLRLSDRTKSENQKININFKNFYSDFSRILNAQSISQGHGSAIPIIYYSKKGKLSGIPDYIYKDDHGHFAVEEKYTFNKYEELRELYYSHKIQALTYLYGLDGFSFSEVFVIYWFVNKDKFDNYKIDNYRIFSLKRSDSNKKTIINIFNTVNSLDINKTYVLPDNMINYNKCIRCNYFKICEYKKRK